MLNYLSKYLLRKSGNNASKILFITLSSSVLATASYAQTSGVSISGLIKNKSDKSALPFVNIVLRTEKDSAFVTGTVSNEEGRFTLSSIKSGTYFYSFPILVMN